MTAVGTSGRCASTLAVMGLSTTWRSIHTWRGRQGTTGCSLGGEVWLLVIGLRPMDCLLYATESGHKMLEHYYGALDHAPSPRRGGRLGWGAVACGMLPGSSPPPWPSPVSGGG